MPVYALTYSFPNFESVHCPMSGPVSFLLAYRFLRMKVGCFGILISLRIFQFAMIHTDKGFSVVDETELDVFLNFPCFLYNPANVDNLISSSSSFSKSSLDIWKFLVRIMLKPNMQDFKHDFYHEQ